MSRFRAALYFLGSRALTIWLAGGFIVYYLTVAVWSAEAVAHVVKLMSSSLLFQALYVLFLANVLVRAGQRLKDFWPRKLLFFARLPLYCGLVLLLFSCFMSANIRKNTWLIVGEGDILNLPWDPSPIRVSALKGALEKDTIKNGSSLIFESEPSVTLIDQSGASYRVGAFPPRLVGTNYMHILNYGIGPGVELREGGREVMRTYLPLRLTPFGTVDTFKLPPVSYRFYLSILPTEVIRKGRETANRYDLAKPRYRVEIVKGDKTIAAAETDESVRFDGNMSLSFHPPFDWVLLDVVYDPFLPLVAGSLVLTGLGLVIYPFSLARRVRTEKSMQGGQGKDNVPSPAETRTSRRSKSLTRGASDN